ncbi:MAG TPA: SDR family oxidoreductase [Pyrinomonadaceae bacterium]|jgi:nucleoside-diphosphate-sugar epimerase|nr:SDR family oxidoreductase [Pyrinomonadaceae bacterium]
MKVLFIGGTGFISTAVSRQAVAGGLDLYLLNRGLRSAAAPGTHGLTADINKPEEVDAALRGLRFDVVVNWIAYTPDDIERDLSLFRGRVGQYVFISSAAAYQKPPAHYVITEETPLVNPFWDYARGKIACEERLMRAHLEEEFPATIVRPSHTYETNFPVAVGGGGSYTLAARMKKGLPVIVHGDGTSLWTLTHAEDFARGFLGLLGNREAIGQAFHITSDEVLTWEQVYRTIAEELGVEANVVHVPSDFIARVVPRLAGTLHGDKKWSAVFDNSKMRKFVPGFRAVIPFREGIRRTLAWFESDERRRRVDESLVEEMELILSSYAGRAG